MKRFVFCLLLVMPMTRLAAQSLDECRRLAREHYPEIRQYDLISQTEQYDIGLDMDMFDYRLNLKLDYYYKYTSSLIYKVSLPRGGLYPFDERTENAMAVSNEGIELELQADILRDIITACPIS